MRTTTQYSKPAGRFEPVHDRLVDQIRVAAAGVGIDLPERPFNNALVEIYEGRYRKMGFHCDQALDLEKGSYIAIVSHYLSGSGELLGGGDNPAVRQLVIKGKETDERLTVSLDHGSVVLFSLATNARYLHKIVLPGGASEDVRWLGLTMRLAKSFVEFRNREAYLDGSPLTLADDQQRRQFYRLRGQENRSTDFAYPRLSYTLSEGDLLRQRE